MRSTAILRVSASLRRLRIEKPGYTFLTTTNAQFVDDLYKKWQQNPKSVHISWDRYFREIENNARQSAPAAPPSPQPDNKHVTTSDSESHGATFVEGSLDVNAAILAYQARGHLIADTDPLGIQNAFSKKLAGTNKLPPEIFPHGSPKGIEEANQAKKFPLGPTTRIGGDQKYLELGEIIRRLNKIYCGHLGLEYIYINNHYVLDWLRDKFEVPGAWNLPPEHRKWIWMRLMRSVTFEAFLAKKYGSEKRFGLEGCDSFIPALDEILETSSTLGVNSFILTMAHRGRLNTLCNVCEKPLRQIFTQFKPVEIEGEGSGDVKYHLGTHVERLLGRNGKKVTVAIVANPSHLEASATLALGRAKAEQVAKRDLLGQSVLPIIVHGDAAYSGQGICYETMHLTNLPDYRTGGVLHVVINNQIGFTTDPRYSRSSAHCTDVARVVNAPIFHVHADDPDLVTYCSKVAAEYRAQFHNDVVLDVVGYRRNGHNEGDEPMLTQPLMYQRIKNHPNIIDIYSKKLLKEGIINETFIKQETDKFMSHCSDEFDKAQTITSMKIEDWQDVPWTKFFSMQSPDNPIPSTGITKETIDTINNHITKPPEGIHIHVMVQRLLKRRQTLIDDGQFDWGIAECLAFGSLLKEGHHVRLSGQDVERGTFSHRMHIVHDQKRDKTWVNILNGIFRDQATYSVGNSPLEEYGISGFELGYATYHHESLVIWEGQFGDFANNCQVIWDNILSSGQTKWGRQVGLVVLLPHGLEGQGPEHSSARLERYLQLCDDEVGDFTAQADPETAMVRQLFFINWIVCNISSPANFLHALRRQMMMPFRKPLIVMTPKSLLRHPMAVSKFDEILPDTRFQPLLPDTLTKPGGVSKVIFCSGKVYYDLVSRRKEAGLEDRIAILRVEQLCPFPYSLVRQEMAKYPKNAKIMWLQEESRNQGGYQYVRERLAHAIGVPIERVVYGGRPCSSSPATGSRVIFQNEHKAVLEAAMRLD